MFKLNADGVQIKCRTRPPQFDEIHQGEFQDIVAVMDDEVMVRLMNIAMIRNVSMLEFLPPPFEILEYASALCLAFTRLSFSAS